MPQPKNDATIPLRVAFKTLGCRLNQAETAVMAGQFSAAGYNIVPFGSPSDVAVVHSCTVTGAAESESFRIGRTARRLPWRPFVVLTGCAAHVNPVDARKRSGADMIVGQDLKLSLPELLATRHSIGSRPAHSHDRPLPLFNTVRATVKTQDGCDFRCAYCAVPGARGPSASRPLRDIVKEVEQLCDTRFKEVVLTGANLGCYRDNRKGLVHLIEAVESIPSVKRIRLSSLELSTCERAVIDCMANSAKMCRFLHIPLQSGDNRILAAMGRRYSATDYRAFVEYAFSKAGEIGLGTDIIVGLPGEDAESFESTCLLAKNLPFSNMHVFPYSKRPGTPASAMPGQVSDAEKKERGRRLIHIAELKRNEAAKRFVGRQVALLVEKISPDGTATGWTGEYFKARIRAHDLSVNQIVTGIASLADGEVLTVNLSTCSGPDS